MVGSISTYLVALIALAACTYYPASRSERVVYDHYNRVMDILKEYGIDKKVHLFVFPTSDHQAYAMEPNKIHFSWGFIDSMSRDELRFVVAHEYSHIYYHHMAKGEAVYNKIINGPLLGTSGIMFSPWKEKLDERQADTKGQEIYLDHGGNVDLFYHPPSIKDKHTSLDPKDSHFSFKDRWEYLRSLLPLDS